MKAPFSPKPKFTSKHNMDIQCIYMYIRASISRVEREEERETYNEDKERNQEELSIVEKRNR